MDAAQQRRRRRRKLARRAALSLLAGLVLAVLVAVVPSAVVSGWPNASFTRSGPPTYFIDPGEMASLRSGDAPRRDVLVRQWRLVGLMDQSWVAPDGIDLYGRIVGVERAIERSRRALEEHRKALLELGGQAPTPPPAAPLARPKTRQHDRTSASRAMLARLPDHGTVLVRTGWPLRAAEGTTHPQGRSNLASVTIAGRRFATPTRPLWLGLSGNTIVYALPILALWAGPGLVRGALRRRRGRCARCGYELAGLERCPECGDFVAP